MTADKARAGADKAGCRLAKCLFHVKVTYNLQGLSEVFTGV